MEKKRGIAPSNIHDQVFYELMSNRGFAVEIYKNYLPEEVTTKIDFSTLELINLTGKVIDEKTHKASQADVVHSIKTTGGLPLLLWCHIEHQTRAEKFMPLRVTHYQCGKLLEHAKLNKCDKLPPIVTIIYHQGKVPYCYSVDLYSLFGEQKLAEKYFGKPILVDLPVISDESLMANKAIGPAEMVLKYIRVRKFSQKYQKIIQGMRGPGQDHEKLLNNIWL